MFSKKLVSSKRIFTYCITALAMFVSNVSGTFAMSSNSGESDALNYAIVFVSRQIPIKGSVYYPQTGSMPGVQPYSRFEVAAPGKLMIRETTGVLRTLVDGSKPTSASLNLIDFNAPSVSYDAAKISLTGIDVTALPPRRLVALRRARMDGYLG